MKDVILKHGKSVFYFKFLPWDTKFFLRPSFILDPDKSLLVPSPGFKALIIKKFRGCFLTARMDSSLGSGIISFLQECLFKYICTEVTLVWDGRIYRGVKEKQKNFVTEIKKSWEAYSDFQGFIAITIFLAVKLMSYGLVI